MIEQLVNVFISPAYADTAAASPQQGGFSMAVMFVVFILFFYFAIWRPQNTRARETRSMLDALAKGDEITTVGGMVGRITKLGDQFITLAVGNNVEVLLQKSSVASVLPKGTIKTIE